MSTGNDLTKEPEILPIGRVSALLGLHPHTIRQAIKAGQLTTVQVGKRRYLLRDDLLKFLGKA